MKLITHKLYSYITLTDTLASSRVSVGELRKNKDASIATIKLRIKQGLTIDQEIDIRAEQQDNASSTSDIVVINKMEVQSKKNVKLDDAIRNLQHQQDNFQEFQRLGHTRKKHEWSLMDITSVLSDLGLTDTFLYGTEEEIYELINHNSVFIEALDKMIYESKSLAMNILLGKKGKTNVTLRPWQQHVLNLIINNSYMHCLLSLAPRFGKTLLVLELAKYYQSQDIKIVLVPASKSLASNESFIEDYKAWGYDFKIIEDASLFVVNKQIVENLKSQIEEDEVLFLVTDEADHSSHTDNSIEKLEAIKENFNIHKIIAMTGTAIYKASKIFLDVPKDDIQEINISYTDLFEFEGIGSKELVKRNFLDVYYPMELMPNGLNIKQSFSQASARVTMVQYIHSFIADTAREDFYGLNHSDVTMCFVPGLIKSHAAKFAKQFQLLFNDTVAVMVINGSNTTNRKAQKLVKQKIDTMKKNGDTRKLMLFSSGMSQRSFSVPNIRRVIILTDGLVSSSFLQMAARCLTFDNSKSKEEQVGDIIRISTANINLMAELFMQEQPEIKHGDVDAEKYGKKFLTHNTFSTYTHTVNDANALVTLNIANSEQMTSEIAKLLDLATQINDSVKYLVGRFFNSDLNYSSVKPEKKALTTTKNVADKPDNKPKGNTPNTPSLTSKELAEREKTLERYISLTRCLPYIGRIIGNDYDTLEETLIADWSFFDTEIGFYKVDFMENLENKDFKTHIESLFRAKSLLTETELNDRSFEIITLIGA